MTGHLRADPEEGRQEPVPAAVGRGDAGDKKKDEAKTDAGKAGAKERSRAKAETKAEPEKKETPFRIDFDGPRPARDPGARRGRQLPAAWPRQGPPPLHRRPARPSTAATRTPKPALVLSRPQGPQGVDPRRRTSTGWALSARRQQGAGAARTSRLQPLRRQARRQGQEDGLDEGPDGRPRARRRSGRRSSTRSGAATATSST